MNGISIKFLYAAFIINMLLMVVLGLYAYFQLVSSKQATDDLYNHPYTVSNSVKTIRASIISMHRYMKDVSLAENSKALNEAITKVKMEEQIAIDEFKVVFERFLGDKSDVNEAFMTFLKWDPIRGEVIRLTKEGKAKQAYSITKNQGADHVEKLEMLIRNLSSFAATKADRLHESVSDQQKEGVLLLSILMTVISLIGFIIFYVLFTTQEKLGNMLQNHLHLIDQNIHIATLDEKGVVLEVTSALCRLIEVSSDEAVRKSFSCLLQGQDTSEEEYSYIIKTNMSGQVWEGDFMRVKKDGETGWVHVSSHPILDGEYKVTGIKMFFKDISPEKESEALAQTDKLTGLLNRRNFENILNRQIRLARRHGLTLEFAILDIDYFKQYNDTYGHPKGDKVLKRVATCMSKVFQRADDYIFRLGGEEFGIIYSLSEDVKQGEPNRAEVLRQQLEEVGIAHESSSVSRFITASIGDVKYCGCEVPTMDAIYREADEALYDAKQKRNCVVRK